jgi:hypothetical protein
MSRRGRSSSLHIGQLSLARRRAIARGWHAPRSSRVPISTDAAPDAVRDFTFQVALATTGPILRYSQRLHLLALANSAGINRFDANLIIAAIEHHRRPTRACAPTQPGEQNQRSERSGHKPFPILLTAATVQAALIALTWAAVVL